MPDDDEEENDDKIEDIPIKQLPPFLQEMAKNDPDAFQEMIVNMT